MLERLKGNIAKYHMIPAGSRILVGISGGMDSVALLHALRALEPELGYTVLAAHLNHGLRGTESDGDALFVEELCQKLAIPLVSAKKMIKELATGENLENCARVERYRWLRQQKELLSASYIAVAHHAQDQAETLLMHLLRGAGLEGLAAMSPMEGDIIRPFLFFDRQDIKAYCLEHGLLWREDSSNDETSYRRNRIRRELMPILAEYNPNIVETLSVTADICRQDNDFLNEAALEQYDALAEQVAGGCRLPVTNLLRLHPALQRRLIRLTATIVCGISSLTYQQVNALLLLANNKELHLAADLYGYRRQGFLYLTRQAPKTPESKNWGGYPQPVPGEVLLPEAACWTKAYWGEMPEKPLPERGLLLALPRELSDGLYWRSRQPGDFLSPRGMTGRRKLKSLLIDCKIAAANRDTIPLLLWQDEIVWVPGCRMGRLATHFQGNALFIELLMNKRKKFENRA